MSVDKKLKELGIELPDAPKPLGAYVPVKLAGGFAFCSGALPLVGGALVHKGKVGSDLTLEQGKDAAKICAINVLANLKGALGGLDAILNVVRVEGYINCAPGYTQLPQVLNGASEFFAEVFGDAGLHSRMVVGVNELPLDAPIELTCIFEVTV